MAEVSNELIYEVLRKVQGTLAEHDRQFRELKEGQARIEQQLHSVRGDVQFLHGDVLQQRTAFGALEMRIERIESRLELRDS